MAWKTKYKTTWSNTGKRISKRKTWTGGWFTKILPPRNELWLSSSDSSGVHRLRMLPPPRYKVQNSAGMNLISWKLLIGLINSSICRSIWSDLIATGLMERNFTYLSCCSAIRPIRPHSVPHFTDATRGSGTRCWGFHLLLKHRV